ncbi:ParB/RepB/Spo0J family partition protein [Burkholderia multivorans]|uniref:ParB/RepB/Spo0J family partition protein n=1 Tax=Burkholderia multivorans TaxID=87883 RepID=UPI001C21EAD3|nr:ParB/RepB/Spo0J family partition protein [Burkholderia multivorans]MBU9205448.1 ParB/RepB/Spo0J family partition protein [Burkholderia multivorans]MBU9413519.1 ParB/RepB/Spo0J family partition protein [Burkholderia multivorans]MCO8353457.1 ParB/RepB/Spo0J family partition protein [Burkholderia multivorans]MCO8385716.1 ParB/RepB/Spo0J family partition protein [Burkholderia multivorans]MCO8406603.1 ParB/RepB/Spo0J family partition protein [Burkholderia multivorans]
MALDLSMLDELHTPAPGAVLDLPIGQIEEDPAQPRKTFSQASLDAMATRIRQKGQVEVPVTVRPMRRGKYRLVDGARRYRSSLIAGMSTIRAIIEADHAIDPYTQVVVNLQREELKPMEVAQFIEQRRAAGDSLGAVADALGLSARDVTAHLSLLDAPAPILVAFQAGRIRSVHGVYDLCRLHGQHAEAVDAFMAEHGDEEITRSMIRRLQALARHGDEMGSGDMTAPAPDHPAVSEEDGSPASDLSDEVPLLHKDGDLVPAMSKSAGHAMPFHDPDIERAAKPPKLNDPTRIRKPLLLADHEGSAVIVRLDRMPTAPGLAFIRYEDGRGEREVELGVLRNWTLTDSKV